MSETVTKVVQGVDSLFDEIVINGRTVKSTPSGRATHTTQVSTAPRAEPVEGEYVGAVQLNNIIHGLKDVPLTQRVANLESGVGNIESLIPSTASSSNKLTDKSYVDTADSGLQTDITNIGAEVTALQTLLGTIQQRLTELNAMIPNQASAQNQLADKAFVNSSISTNTANFLGTYTTLADIEAIQNPTNNDYAFLETTDASGNTVFDRYKYSGADSQWLFEYELNNSSFTAEQWATINSGLTANSVTNAINALDVASVGGNNKYIKAISETNGKISATEGSVDTSVTQNSANPVTSGAVWTALQGITPPSVVDTVAVGNMNPVTSNAVALEVANMSIKFIPDFTRPIYQWKDSYGNIIGYYSRPRDAYFTATEDCFLMLDVNYTFDVGTQQSYKYARFNISVYDNNNNAVTLFSGIFDHSTGMALPDKGNHISFSGVYIKKGARVYGFFDTSEASSTDEKGVYWNDSANQYSSQWWGVTKPRIFPLVAQSTS